MALNKDKIRASAQKFLQKGQIDKAIREFERLVEEDPKDVRTLLKIGDLYTRAEKTVEATQTYSRVAQFYSDQGFFLKAVAVYKQILKLDPAIIEINLKLADLYHQLGLLSDAINQYRSLAQLYEKENRLDEEVATLRKIVELDSDNVAGRIKLAEIYAKQNMVEEARHEFKRAADFLKRQNRLDDYMKVAERIVHFEATDLATTRELANYYIQKNDSRRALAKLQVCFKANPKDIETLQLLAVAFAELEQVPKAVSVYRELARIFEEKNDTTAYRGVMAKVLQLMPNDAEAQGAMGQGGFSAAEDHSEDIEIEEDLLAGGNVAAAQINDQNEIVNRMLVEADIYIKYGLRPKAIEHLRKIISLEPSHRGAQEKLKNLHIEGGDVATAAELLLSLARRDMDQDDKVSARDSLEELLGLDPNNTLALEMMAQIAPDAGVVPVDEASFDEWNGDDVAAVDVSYEPSPVARDFDFDEEQSLATENDLLDELGIETEIETEIELPEPSAAVVEEKIPEPLAAKSAAAPVKAAATVKSEKSAKVAALSDDLDALLSAAVPQRRPAPAPKAPVTAPAAVAAKVVAKPVTPPAVQDLSDEIGEVRFFVENGLDDEAEDALAALLSKHPDHPEVLALSRELQSLGGKQEEEGLGVAKGQEEHIAKPAALTLNAADFSDFEMEISSVESEAGTDDIAFADVFEEFKKGVAKQVDESDFETHYNLGIAYKEMDLLDDAIREFELALKFPQREIDSLTMIGLCELQRGNQQVALEHFLRGLNSKAVKPVEAVALRYEIGAAYESMGKAADALKFFEKAHSMDPRFRDVEARVTAVRDQTEVNEQGGEGHELDQLLEDTAAEQAARGSGGKISYL